MEIIEALEAAGIEVHYKDNGEIDLCCPFCVEEGQVSNDERFRLGINTRNGKASCFNCGKKSGGGDWIFKELERVLQTGEIEASHAMRKSKSNGHVVLPDGFESITTHNHWGRQAYRYLRSRGITDRQMDEKDIGFTVVDRKYSHRCIFPAYIKGKLKCFVTRTFVKGVEPKYKNSEGDKTLYNYPDKQNKECVLSESAIPALVIERAVRKLHMDSMGVLGHSLTDNMLELLEPYRRITFWFDPDIEGVKGAIKSAQKLPKDKIVKFVTPKRLDYDPDEFEQDEITKRVLKAEVSTETLQTRMKSWCAFSDE